MSNETYRKECIEHHEKNGDFVQIEDGRYVFFPTRESLGAMGAHHLRWIADELDRLNSNEELKKVKERLAMRLYNSGYKAGHHDTVEAVYVDIHWFDMENYHEEEALEIIKDFFDEDQPTQ